MLQFCSYKQYVLVTHDLVYSCDPAVAMTRCRQPDRGVERGQVALGRIQEETRHNYLCRLVVLVGFGNPSPPPLPHIANVMSQDKYVFTNPLIITSVIANPGGMKDIVKTARTHDNLAACE